MFPWLILLKDWGLKFFSGFFPSSGEKVGKILWVGLIALLVSACFNFFQKPTNVYKGDVKQIYTDNPQARYSFFGCSGGHIRAGLQWKW